jgi:membrane-bound metal-dependent hydrolase YbcI (DUF457 family)
MASFKSHISFGAITAIFVISWMVYVSLISMAHAPFFFILTIVSSMLPDLDSDTGIPVRILFSVLAFIGVTGVFLTNSGSAEFFWKDKVTDSFLVFLTIYFGIRGLFKFLTVHRGIFHSIPAAFLMGLIGMTIAEYYQFETKLAVGFAISSGYLCHLVLDELNSAINMDGTTFKPKKSLGTALKLYSANKVITVIIYLAIIILVLINDDLFHRL